MSTTHDKISLFQYYLQNKSYLLLCFTQKVIMFLNLISFQHTDNSLAKTLILQLIMAKILDPLK